MLVFFWISKEIYNINKSDDSLYVLIYMASIKGQEERYQHFMVWTFKG
jgi:hypothetical protein